MTLECEAKVLSAMRVEPATVSFGQIQRDDPEQTKTITITRGDGGPLDPKVLATGNPQIAAELREIEPGERYEVDVTIRPPWPNEMLRGTLSLETGVERAPQESIVVFANVTPRLQANPQRFMIQMEPEAAVELTARLNWDGQPGKVLEATVNDPELAVRVDEQDGEQVLVLDVPAKYSPKRRTGSVVTLRTDDPTVSIVQVPIFVINRAATPASPAPRTGRGARLQRPTPVTTQPSGTAAAAE